MTLRMAKRIDDPQAGDDLITSLHHFHLFLDRRVIAPRAGDEPRTFSGEPACCIFASPEIPFRTSDEKRSIRNHQLVELIDGAPKMVGVPVSENHFRDLPLVDAGCFEILPEL